MSKKNKHEKHQHGQKKQTESTVVSPLAVNLPSRSTLRMTAFFLMLIGVVLYANTFNHGFVLDDHSVIRDNKLTTQGLSATKEFFKSGLRTGNFLVEDNLYRPLTKTFFAAQWQIAPDNASFFHGVNILLYGFLCALLFLTWMRLMPGKYYVALIGTLIFAFHPLHTEVVANIKSADEILSFIFLLFSIQAAVSYVEKKSILWLFASAALYFLGLLTKENAITFLALLPVTLWFFTNAKRKEYISTILLFSVVTVVYLYIHRSVIGMIGLENVPVVDNSLFATKSFLSQRITAIYILGLYLRLLLIPHPLSCDYSFNTIPNIETIANGGFLLSFAIHVFALWYAIRYFKSKNIGAYAIWFYLISISVVSNVIVLIGTNMGERLVFYPSAGFTLLIAFVMDKFIQFPKDKFSVPALFSKVPVIAILAPVLLFYGFKTIDRNKDWESDATLFAADVKTVPNSAHMLYYHAGVLADRDSLAFFTPDVKMYRLQQAEQILVRSIAIYEPFPNVHSLIGRVYKDMGNYEKAIYHYERTLQLNDKDPTTHNNLATCFFETGKLPKAENHFSRAIELSPFCYDDAICNLGSVYGMMGDGYRYNGLGDSAMIYYNKAIDKFNETIKCNNEYPNAYRFLGFTYRSLGDSIKANEYFATYERLNALPKK
ncbi:MAG TPA: tetratricopeptide repeat protein [Flavobacteriales bacterium]|nr:tetratricopeptide repeat protein [Flavobacteriales bacterium]HRE95764.1 tetratricopeptide repeat protein [Flavobacteriales bacterium]HRJ38725.1 tetratricopeptide repeat protein [Flavobacteriales bacterium]